MSDQELDERVQRAVDNFMAGYGCCQSVVAAFSDLYGLDETLAKKIAAGFGEEILYDFVAGGFAFAIATLRLATIQTYEHHDARNSTAHHTQSAYTAAKTCGNLLG